MSIRLIKISKDLNVGISSLVEFLHKKGFDVESNPNTKVDGEQHELLVREFGSNSDLEVLFSNRREREREREKAKEAETGTIKEEVAVAERKEPEEIKTEVPEDIKPHVQIVDKNALVRYDTSKKCARK